MEDKNIPTTTLDHILDKQQSNNPKLGLEFNTAEKPTVHTKAIQQELSRRILETLYGVIPTVLIHALLLAILAQPFPIKECPNHPENIPTVIYENTFSDTELQSQFNQELQNKPFTEENYKKALLNIYNKNPDTFYTKLDIGLFFITLENLKSKNKNLTRIDLSYQKIQNYIQEYKDYKYKPNIKDFLESKTKNYSENKSDLNDLLTDIDEDPLYETLEGNCEARFKLEASILKKISPETETYALVSGPSKTYPYGHVQLTIKKDHKFQSITSDGVSADNPAIYKAQDIVIKILGHEINPLNTLTPTIKPNNTDKNQETNSLLLNIKQSGQVKNIDSLEEKLELKINQVTLKNYLSLVSKSKQTASFSEIFETISPEGKLEQTSLKQSLFEKNNIYTYEGENREVFGVGGTQPATAEQKEIIEELKKALQDRSPSSDFSKNLTKYTEQWEGIFFHNHAPFVHHNAIMFLTKYVDYPDRLQKVVKTLSTLQILKEENIALIDIAKLLSKKSTNSKLELQKLKNLINTLPQETINNHLKYLSTYADNQPLRSYMIQKGYYSHYIVLETPDLTPQDIHIIFKKFPTNSEYFGDLIIEIVKHPNVSYKTLAEIASVPFNLLEKNGRVFITPRAKRLDENVLSSSIDLSKIISLKNQATIVNGYTE